jgi:hypothetical protein
VSAVPVARPFSPGAGAPAIAMAMFDMIDSIDKTAMSAA